MTNGKRRIANTQHGIANDEVNRMDTRLRGYDNVEVHCNCGAWIPACAGMTSMRWDDKLKACGNDSMSMLVAIPL